MTGRKPLFDGIRINGLSMDYAETYAAASHFVDNKKTIASSEKQLSGYGSSIHLIPQIV